jgi:hypothetical protein
VVHLARCAGDKAEALRQGAEVKGLELEEGQEIDGTASTCQK